MRVCGTDIEVVKGDITELSVDAIVNAANNEFRMGGGVAGAIRKKGGAAIEEEAVKKGPKEVGEAVVTAAGVLKAKYIIHAATMALDHKTNEHCIRAACANGIKRAEELRLTSIALPALGCGVGGFPLVASAKIMTQEVLKAVRRKGSSLEKILFCLYDDTAYDIYRKSVFGYIEHLTEDLAWGPYVTTDIIIEMDGGIVLIERSNPPFGWALPGGFLDAGESLEEAARREAKEETGLELLNLEQFHTYSDPGRDPRFHTVTTVFTAHAKGTPLAGDDAKGIKIVPLSELMKGQYAFDHNKVIEDFLTKRK